MRGKIWLWLLLLGALGCRKNHDSFHSPVPFQQQPEDRTATLRAEMTTPEKVGQLFILQAGPEQAAQVLQLVETGTTGGLLLEQWPLANFISVADSCRHLSRTPLFWATRESILLNNQFAGTSSFPAPASIQSLPSDSLRSRLHQVYRQQLRALGINLVLGAPVGKATGDNFVIPGLNNDHILCLEEGLGALSPALDQTLPNGTGHQISAGVSGLFVDPALLHPDSLQQWPVNYLANRLKQSRGFDGLLVSVLAPGADPLPLLRTGIDLLITVEVEKLVSELTADLGNGDWTPDFLEEKVAKVLLAKQWMREGLTLPVPREQPLPIQASLASLPRGAPLVATPPADSQLLRYFYSDRWDYLTHKLYEESVVLVNNHDNLLPFGRVFGRNFRLLQIGDEPFDDFHHFFRHYAEEYTISQRPTEEGALPAIKDVVSDGWTHVILLETNGIEQGRDQSFIQSVHDLARREEVVLVNFGDPLNLQSFDTTLTIVQVFERNSVTEATAAQLLFGALEAKGRLPVTINDYFPAGLSNSTPVQRLKYGRSEEVGIAPERLVGIDAIARTAIQDRATPGCQVVIAKDGKIIYRKAFGWHTYQKKQAVKETDLYDLASITKVAATTLATMSLYERKQLNPADRLGSLIACEKDASIQRISLKKLMTHQSGLQPHMPIVPYLLYRDMPNAECDSFFCKELSNPYTVPIADHFYFQQTYLDTIWQDLNHLPVGSQRRYRYSDVNFVLVQKILEEKSGQPLDQLVKQKFYFPLGLRRTTFRPLDRFERTEIVPTQNDTRWRQQLVHGYVHDETAAIYGGVAGNAGLFSTAEELAVIFQLLLNDGSYAGQQLLSPETIRYFTSAQHGNHRGLGFNKPASQYRASLANDAPASTFGHTGFTGTCAWADPDHGLIYIFLSNRIHPDANNRKLFKNKVRERIHQVVYDALDSYQLEIPELTPELKGG